MWYRIFKYVLVGPLLRVFVRPRTVGLEHVPGSGPVIVAANHLAMIDSLILCLVLPRRLGFVAKSEYFERPGPVGLLQRWFFTAAGQIPIDRTDSDAAGAALDTACRLLEVGGVWAVHPEGTRSRDGSAHRGRTGTMRVAQRTGAPVIPVGIRGTAAVNPPGSRLLRPGRVEVVIGRPLDVDVDEVGVRAATDLLLDRITVLSGQRYVDRYA
ncbi:MAG: lysophospholipid acyltransferase family protein [Gordonia sp. (in: high G+C Gram-positive bacteria)]|uniref:lysophospholipid acyltransferase family protein n=1 Tax=Gordonia sp. (in: high G+C Gram-positive bacteria) TaxID=84139 RepID=UPI0039E4D695